MIYLWNLCFWFQVVWKIPARISSARNRRRRRRAKSHIKLRRMLCLYSGGCSGISLHQLRQGPPAGVGGFRRFFVNPNKKPTGPEDGKDPLRQLLQAEFGSVRPGLGPEKQAGAEVEPDFLTGTCHGVSRRSSLLLRPVDRTRYLPVLVHGRRTRGDRHRSSHVLGRRTRLPFVAAVSVGLRVERFTRCWMRETRVGRTCNRFALLAVT